MPRGQVVLCGILVLGLASALSRALGTGLLVLWQAYHRADVMLTEAVDEQIRMALGPDDPGPVGARRQGMRLDWVALPPPGSLETSPAPESLLPEQVIGVAHHCMKSRPHLALLQAKRYADLDSALDRLRGQAAGASGIDPLEAALAELRGDLRLGTQAVSWKQARPDSFWARLLVAEALGDEAWVYRTSSTLNHIPAGRGNLFRETAARALEELRVAVRLRPDEVRGWSALARVRASQFGIDGQVRDAILRAIDLDPLHQEAYRTWIHFSLPQWGGSVDRILLIAARCLGLAERDPRMVLAAWIAYAAVERAPRSDRKPLDDPEVRGRLEPFLEAMLERYPDSVEARRVQADLAFRAGDRERGQALQAAAREAAPRGPGSAEGGRGPGFAASRALQDLLPSANMAVGEALVAIGDLYREGRPGLGRDPAAATRWYEQAARSGHGPGFLRLAAMIEGGEAGTRDPAVALAWLEAGAAREHVGCMLEAAALMLRRPGSPPERARQLLAEAAGLGSPRAAQWLARIGSGPEVSP